MRYCYSQSRPGLEEAQQSQQPQHAQEADVDTRIGEKSRDRNLDDREPDNDTIEHIPAVGPVLSAAHAQLLEGHLNDEDACDQVAKALRA